MRFQTSGKRGAPNYLARSQQWRLLLLVMGLGLVVGLMRQVRQPQTANKLQQVFTPERRVSDAEIRELTSQSQSGLSGDVFRIPHAVAPLQTTRVDYFPGVKPALLATIRDNSYFRSQETKAWFHMLGLLQDADSEKLSEASQGEVGYVQLIEQPQFYRGQVVTIRGNVRRAETLPVAENDISLAKYHLLTLRPTGGQIWPMRVYCLELPAGFPLGDEVSADVSVTGFFFKNWSYNWEGGLGLAPVILAKGIDWSKNSGAGQ